MKTSLTKGEICYKIAMFTTAFVFLCIGDIGSIFLAFIFAVGGLDDNWENQK